MGDGATRRPSRSRLPAILLSMLLVVGVLTACDPPWIEARIDLRVLVLDDGSTNVEMLTDELTAQGVPHTVVSLSDLGRPTIDEEFLTDPAAPAGHARYQGVVLPGPRPPGLDPAELTAIHGFQREFGIRVVSAFTWPVPENGAYWPAAGPTYAGPMDGLTAQVRPGARVLFGDVFRSLDGPVPFDVGSWGSLAEEPELVVGDDAFLPLVEVGVPGQDGTVAPVVGIRFSADGEDVYREEMQLLFTANSFQRQAQLLAPDIIDWLTRGVRLGHSRNYLSVDVDDVFLSDDRWSIDGNCTPGEDCPVDGEGEPLWQTQPIRMTPDDVATVAAWQDAFDFRLDMAFNAGGSVEASTSGPDPLTDAFLLRKDEFDWINHTYTHEYLGCVKDSTVVPWQCVTDPVSGETQWVDQAAIEAEIVQNSTWALGRGIPLDTRELITGEHSGLAVLPQQPTDNPHLAPALETSGVEWMASDSSREPTQRAVGPALTVPRHPMNVFYNVATVAGEVDEYNWIYTSVADGGSGICEVDPNSTCLPAPLGPDGFESYIVPIETSIALRHVLANDPRPHYAHQSNLAEDRILLSVLESLITEYRALFADDLPLVGLSQTETGRQLREMAAWMDDGVAEGARVTAYRQGHEVVIDVAGEEAVVPLTVPEGSPFGEPYAGRRSAWTTVGADGTRVVLLP